MHSIERQYVQNKFCNLNQQIKNQENINQQQQIDRLNKIAQRIDQQQIRITISDTDQESDSNVLMDSKEFFNKEESIKNCILYDFQSFYILQSPIIENRIFKCKNISTGSMQMAKIFINQNNLFFKLNRILKYIPHKNILWFDKFFQENKKIIGITELLEGGNLWEVFQSSQFKFSLQQIQIIMKALLKGLNHLHQNGIMHRDIKLTNIIFKNRQDLKTLKIIDFEFATFISNPQCQDCGTEGYIAPEVKRKSNYNEKCDIYSAGVIFYILMFQKRLQEDDDNLDISLIKHQTDEIQEYQVALDLLQKMLQNNPDTRINCEQCLQHKFFNKKDSKLNYKIKKMGLMKFKNPFYKYQSF